jgi:hypothetical protein
MKIYRNMRDLNELLKNKCLLIASILALLLFYLLNNKQVEIYQCNIYDDLFGVNQQKDQLMKCTICNAAVSEK